jgi:hypothetical protein
MVAPRASARTARPRPGRDPEVIVDVLFESGLLFLALKNLSGRVAYDVSVRFDPPLAGLGGTVPMDTLALFRDVTFLAPGREIRTLLDSSESYFAAGQPARVAATVTFIDAAGRKHTATIRHNLEIYRRLAYVTGATPPREGQ